MKSLERKIKDEKDYEQYSRLLSVALQDPFIQNRLLELLQLDSYRRRQQLNIWLEQLRIRKAPQKLRRLLAYLFDDDVAEKTVSLIKKQANYNQKIRT